MEDLAASSLMSTILASSGETRRQHHQLVERPQETRPCNHAVGKGARAIFFRQRSDESGGNHQLDDIRLCRQEKSVVQGGAIEI